MTTNAETIPWSDVEPNWTIIGKDGKHWLVSERYPDGRVLLIRTSDKREHMGSPTGSAQVVNRPLRKAVDTVVEVLGGVEVGARSGPRGTPWTNPVDFKSPAELHAHLMIFHGKGSDTADLDGLRKEHDAMHKPDEKATDLYEPHIHTPDWRAGK